MTTPRNLTRHRFAAICAASLFFILPARATVIVGPFLEGATTTNVFVVAECDATTPLTVNYGTTSSYGVSANTTFTLTTGVGATNVHRIKLTGLLPNTLYHYQLVGQGLTSPDYTFRTLVEPGTNFRFTWQADFRTGTSMHQTIANLVRLSNPLFVLEGGDTCANGDIAGWHNEFFTSNERELGKWFPIYPSPGNHEGWGTLTKAYYQSPDTTGSNGYYSFDCGEVHFTMANYIAPYTVGSAQYNWILQDLQNSLKPWKIFGTHAPAYTYSSSSHQNDAGFVTVTSNILQPNGVKVFFGGHNHFYQHNLVNGIRHLTVGAAGAPLVTPTNHPLYTVLSVKTNCYMVVDVTATNLHMVAYDEHNYVLDVIDLYKPAAPTGVAAVAGDAAATLTWDAVPQATNYTVYYGTRTGGPYPSRKNSTSTGTAVTGLANGTTYYFVVTASDTNGPSAVSTEVSARPASLIPQIVSYALDSNGSFNLSGTGLAGQDYVLLSAANLVPAILWTPVQTNRADPAGLFQLRDLEATNYGQRFYRVATP